MESGSPCTTGKFDLQGANGERQDAKDAKVGRENISATDGARMNTDERQLS
jgi:hypothetical protein